VTAETAPTRPQPPTMTAGAVRELVGAVLEDLPATTHLIEPIVRRTRLEPDRAVAAHRVGDRFVDVTATEFLQWVRQLAKGLIASGVGAGDRVALMSRTRLEWMALDYAILATGAVTVPVYETSAAEQLRWIIDDSGSVVVITETPATRGLPRRRPRSSPRTAGSAPVTSGRSSTATCASPAGRRSFIVTAGGKNVAPGPLEDGLRAHPLVSQALVIGDNRPFVAALIRPKLATGGWGSTPWSPSRRASASASTGSSERAPIRGT